MKRLSKFLLPILGAISICARASQVTIATPQKIDVTPDNIGQFPICLEFVAEDYGVGEVQYVAVLAIPEIYNGKKFEDLSAGDIYFPNGAPSVSVRPELTTDTRFVSVAFGQTLPVSYQFEVLYGDPLHEPGKPMPETYVFSIKLAPFTKEPTPELEVTYCNAP